jgi:hypothetical protein
MKEWIQKWALDALVCESPSPIKTYTAGWVQDFMNTFKFCYPLTLTHQFVYLVTKCFHEWICRDIIQHTTPNKRFWVIWIYFVGQGEKADHMGNGNWLVSTAYSQYILKEWTSLPIQCHSEDMKEQKHRSREGKSMGKLRCKRGEKNY